MVQGCTTGGAICTTNRAPLRGAAIAPAAVASLLLRPCPQHDRCAILPAGRLRVTPCAGLKAWGGMVVTVAIAAPALPLFRLNFGSKAGAGVQPQGGRKAGSISSGGSPPGVKASVKLEGIHQRQRGKAANTNASGATYAATAAPLKSLSLKIRRVRTGEARAAAPLNAALARAFLFNPCSARWGLRRGLHRRGMGSIWLVRSVLVSALLPKP